MRDGRRGFALTGIACFGALACGPDKPASDSGETGYPLDTDTGTDSTSESETGTSPTTGEPQPECSFRGDICGEYSICQCSCDYTDDCCYCAQAECTEDEHCGEGLRCAELYADYEAVRECVPDFCGSYLGWPAASGISDPDDFNVPVCATAASIIATSWVDVAPFAPLRHLENSLAIEANELLVNLDGLAALEVVGQIYIENNPALTSVAGLAGLQTLGGGSITNNPLLPTADVEALLAQIPGGANVAVCGNLDGEPC